MMNRKLKLSFGLALLAALSTGSHAYSWNILNGDTRSGVLDATGMEGTESKFGLFFDLTDTDSDFYLNQINILPGSNYDANLNLFNDLNYGLNANGNFSQDEYELGTALTQEGTYFFDGIVRRNGTVDSSIATGLYDFQVELIGGDSNTATEVVGTFDFNLEVVDTITATLTGNMSPGIIGPGQSSSLTATLTNLGTRDMITTTWYVSAFAKDGDYSNPDNFLQFDDFQGNWFNQTVAANGGTRTDLHSKWSKAATNMNGQYLGRNGVYGGLYNGDTHSWRATGDTLEVVPEPASMFALSAGVALLLRRRKA